MSGLCYGAGNGNRTRIKSLGSSHSTIELYPQKVFYLYSYCRKKQQKNVVSDIFSINQHLFNKSTAILTTLPLTH